ncbi:MAG TPA: DUF4389 domain-containing protein, partial [Acidimicrobiales bacterium]|nr:DUF4389 domain-containing protein [Acidimicrobiales bacterium]
MVRTLDRPMLQAGFGTPVVQNRWTVFFRLVLAIPQFVVLFVYGIAAVVLVVLGWFAALVMGRLPRSFAAFLASYVQYATRVTAYLYLMHDAYPPFALESTRSYPVNLDVGIGPVRRLAVLFRIFLLIPAAIVASVSTAGMGVAAVFIWLIVLVAGRMPVALFEAEAAVLRFSARYNAYAVMLTGKYPGELFGDTPTGAPAAQIGAPPTPAFGGVAAGPVPAPVPPMPATWQPPTAPAPSAPAAPVAPGQGEEPPTAPSYWRPPMPASVAVPPPPPTMPPPPPTVPP